LSVVLASLGRVCRLRQFVPARFGLQSLTVRMKNAGNKRAEVGPVLALMFAGSLRAEFRGA
jgi:hypothetical protein